MKRDFFRIKNFESLDVSLEALEDPFINGFRSTYAPQNIIFYIDKIYIHLNRVWVSWCATGIEYEDVRFLDIHPDNLFAVPMKT